ncbi:hypothetical protein ACN38_g11122 [Penicillium nordicum]|uniref:Uncharacterized protein n=1 Tax=Penicillium nordicum TaxID=229535 RepID=A0A0M9WB38_9EURO|nr:hypothetical protein ACN38_g11122 [Penicillium nordicum]
MGHRLSWSLKVGPIAHCWLAYGSKVLDQLGPLRRSTQLSRATGRGRDIAIKADLAGAASLMGTRDLRRAYKPSDSRDSTVPEHEIQLFWPIIILIFGICGTSCGPSRSPTLITEDIVSRDHPLYSPVLFTSPACDSENSAFTTVIGPRNNSQFSQNPQPLLRLYHMTLFVRTVTCQIQDSLLSLSSSSFPLLIHRQSAPISLHC